MLLSDVQWVSWVNLHPPHDPLYFAHCLQPLKTNRIWRLWQHKTKLGVREKQTMCLPIHLDSLKFRPELN